MFVKVLRCSMLFLIFYIIFWEFEMNIKWEKTLTWEYVRLFPTEKNQLCVWAQKSVRWRGMIQTLGEPCVACTLMRPKDTRVIENAK